MQIESFLGNNHGLRCLIKSFSNNVSSFWDNWADWLDKFCGIWGIIDQNINACESLVQTLLFRLKQIYPKISYWPKIFGEIHPQSVEIRMLIWNYFQTIVTGVTLQHLRQVDFKGCLRSCNQQPNGGGLFKPRFCYQK